MGLMLTLQTSKFSVFENNEFIGSKYLIEWLQEKIEGMGYRVTDRRPEDSGWYLFFEVDGCSHYFFSMVQELESENSYEWMIQIGNSRTFIHKLLGKFSLEEDSELVESVANLLRSEEEIHDVCVVPCT